MNSTSSVCISDLPEETLLHTFSFLNVESLCTAAQVNRYWNALVSDNSLWEPPLKSIAQCLPEKPKEGWKSIYPFYQSKTVRFRKIRFCQNMIWSARGNALALWCKNRETLSFESTYTPSTHKYPIACFDVRTFGIRSVLITGSFDKTIKVWEKMEASCRFSEIQTLRESKSPVLALAGIGVKLFSGDEEGNISFWTYSIEMGIYNYSSQTQAHERSITCLLINTKNPFQTLLSGSKDRTIKEWIVREGKIHLVRTLSGHQDAITCMNFNRAFGYIFSGSADGTVKIWQNGDEITTLPPNQGPITSIYAEIKPAMILTAGENKTVKFWFRTLNHKEWASGKVFSIQGNEPVTDIQAHKKFQQNAFNHLYWATASKIMGGSNTLNLRFNETIPILNHP